MREYELRIDEALKNGLSPERMTPFNTQFLWEALGFRLGRLGLEAYIDGENPLPDTIDMFYNWPFPQFLVGEAYNILVVRDSLINHIDEVYTVNNEMSVITHIFSVDELTFGVGELMEMADFGEYIFMTNGVIMIYWDPDLAAWQTMTTSTTIPMMKTICNFKGQAVGGNIVSVWHDCDETFYVWSKIGEMDFTPDDYNEAGYRRCPYGGEVYHTRRLGDSVVGYSSKGITLLYPVTDPAPTFGFKELSDIGLHNKGAMAGNLNKHVYVGSDLIVREITSEGVKELGYQYWMDELDDDNEDIIVLHDKSKDNFYIGNSTKTFLLSPYGMTESPQHPSAVWRIDPDEPYLLPDTVDDYQPTITTEVFDMGYKGNKTIEVVETDAFLGTNPMAAVDYAFDLVNWGFGEFISINNDGVAYPTTVGNFFRFRIRFDTYYNGSRIGYINVRYKMSDLRSIRGVHAPPPRGQ